MRASQARTDAMRSRLHILHLQYAAWSQASSLFEYLDKIGRKTPSSVMAALKQDSSLLGHMAGVVLACKELQKWLGGKLDQLLTSSEYLKPFFIRRRDENGSAAIHPNLANPEARNPKDGTIELVLTSLLREGGPESNPSTLLRALWPVLQKHTEASKITADAFDCLGDFGIVSEFVGGLVDTTFGKELKQLVAEANKSGASKSWFTTLCAIPESKLQRLPPTPRFDLYGELDAIVASQANQWLEVVFSLDGRPGLDTIIATNELVPHYDHLWMYIDSTLWEAAEQLEGTPGSLKDMYGLVNPDHEERPRYSREFLKEFYRVEHERKESAPTPAPAAQPSESSIPVAIPGQDEVARAPPRPTEAPKTKRKGKGKKKKAPRPSPNDAAEPPEDKEADEDHPFIPNLSKLSHKTIEIFQRLLSHEEKSGQIRWGDFEKAMAQAGFDVIQTEGSSVRFDPLVGDARPISFHRPHPDSTLSPVLIRWTGARLKRRYGWTASTFSTESANVDTAAEAE
ncbi:hypothetical protein BOTBODRAFT_55453 [Botryobasidium botryosum FD-172 SS1]|uniref:Uncharacterized protein n=1 Tax=Botryobasidium botryosum (strain FD-172 SS1) TaxID=930990 RepID=A0A067MHS7_BOTB1|nr:hypothetical protein BOTBODRAFT_55453 [Botryobasidium botryosum FD-172 SS1]